MRQLLETVSQVIPSLDNESMIFIKFTYGKKEEDDHQLFWALIKGEKNINVLLYMYSLKIGVHA
jgi:hypothetical protein